MQKDNNKSDYGLADGDEHYRLVHETLTDAVLTALDSPQFKGRAPHTIHPHIRQKHVFELRNGDINFGTKRLCRLAKALGIEIEINVKLPPAA